jgi:hypothetical protein
MLAIVDADVFAYRCGFAAEKEGQDEGTCLALLSSLLEKIVYDELEADSVVGYLTGSGNFRNNIATTAPYKGQRKGVKPAYYSLIRKYMSTAWGFETVDDIEADDAVATYASSLDVPFYVVAVDKDFKQLGGMWHYNWVKKEKFYVTEWEGIYNLYKQVLMGDVVDNIIGVKGIGDKKSDKLFEDCQDERSLFTACVEAFKGDEGRVVENLQLLYLQRTTGDIWHKGKLDESTVSKSKREETPTISKRFDFDGVL